NFWNLFALLESGNPAVVLSLAAFFGLSSLAILLRTRRPGDPSTLPIVVAAVMVSELVGLSIMRAYPFGGLLRHQYIVGPFLILAVFVVIDRLASVSGRRARIALLASVSVLSIGNLVVRWPMLV